MSKKLTIMVPVEITLHRDDYDLRGLHAQFSQQGPFPDVCGTGCSWRARFDKIRLKDIRTAVNGTREP